MHVDAPHHELATQRRARFTTELAGFEECLDLFFREGFDRHLFELGSRHCLDRIRELELAVSPGEEST